MQRQALPFRMPNGTPSSLPHQQLLAQSLFAQELLCQMPLEWVQCTLIAMHNYMACLPTAVEHSSLLASKSAMLYNLVDELSRCSAANIAFMSATVLNDP